MGFFDDLWVKTVGARESYNVTGLGTLISETSGATACQAMWAFTGVGITTVLCTCFYCFCYR